jgi:hypothetical protein
MARDVGEEGAERHALGLAYGGHERIRHCLCAAVDGAGPANNDASSLFSSRCGSLRFAKKHRESDSMELGAL